MYVIQRVEKKRKKEPNVGKKSSTLFNTALALVLTILTPVQALKRRRLGQRERERERD
jgi:hypothetical protein